VVLQHRNWLGAVRPPFLLTLTKVGSKGQIGERFFLSTR
jgi:hypothetical protein